MIVIDADDKEARETKERKSNEQASKMFMRLATFGQPMPTTSTGKCYILRHQ